MQTVERSLTTRDSITHQIITTDTSFQQILGYDLINVEKRTYKRYTSFSESAVKSEEGTVSPGVNSNDFEDYGLKTSIVKDLNDTLIDHKNFKRVLLKSDTGSFHYIAYFEPVKVQSPFQLSKILNTKYNATLFRLELFHQNGERFDIEMKYKPGNLTKEQKDVIAQWIKNEN